VTKSGNLLFTSINDKEPGLNLLKLDGTIRHLDHFDAFKFFKPSKSYSIGKNQLVVSLHLSKDDGTIVAGCQLMHREGITGYPQLLQQVSKP
jgi:hypothetical protein